MAIGELGDVLLSFGDVPIEVRVELDRLNLKLVDVLNLAPGSVLSLPKPAGEPLDIYVGGILLGSGEIMLLNENLGVRVTAHVSRIRKLTVPVAHQEGERDLIGFLKEAPEKFRHSSVLGSVLEGLVSVGIVIGRAWLPLEKILNLAPGSFLELDTTHHQPAELAVDGQLLAFGEVVVVDGNYGIRIQSVAVYRETLARAKFPAFAAA
jgi:flagellar motor switch protein FliN